MKYSTKSLALAAGAGAVAMLILVVGVALGAALFSPSFSPGVQAAPLPQTAGDTQLVAAYEQTLVDLYQASLPSVVSIRVTKQFDRSVLERFFGPQDEPDESEPEEESPEDQVPPDFFNQGGGSGFVWDTQGHIVTNYHVVSDASDIEVIFADDTTVPAELVGSDPDSDLAVIKVDLPADYLQPVKPGNSDEVQVGHLAIAMGNPFGQEFTMTSGIVSGVGRLIRGGNAGFSIPEVIQTDAPINPGNSGGPLLNRQGEVIGVNSQIISQTGASSGIGFAVPISIVQRVVPALINGETVEYAWLGISGSTVTRELVDARDLPAGTQGALVAGVVEDGPADVAGLQGRDENLDPDEEGFLFGGEIITAIDGEPIHGIDDLITYLVKATEPGQTVTLDIIDREGQPQQVEVTLGTRPTADANPFGE